MSANIPQTSSVYVSLSNVEVSVKPYPLERIKTEALSLVPENHFFPAMFMIQLLDKYQADDLERVLKDFNLLKNQTFRNAEKDQTYVVTTGGPCAGKSTFFEKFKENQGVKFAYIDPDRSCLLNMENTYKQDLIDGSRSPQEAYMHWREASNFLANVFLAHALDQGYAIAHGSTMADPRSIDALRMIGGRYGYKRTLLHFTCGEELRLSSELTRREGGIVQCTDEDLVKKGKQFHKRLSGYLEESEDIVFLYRTDMKTVVEYGRRENLKFEFTNPGLAQKAAVEHDTVCGEGDWEKVLAR